MAPSGCQKDIALKADKFTLCYHQVKKSQGGSAKVNAIAEGQRKEKRQLENCELKWVTLAGNQCAFSDVCSCAN